MHCPQCTHRLDKSPEFGAQPPFVSRVIQYENITYNKLLSILHARWDFLCRPGRQVPTGGPGSLIRDQLYRRQIRRTATNVVGMQPDRQIQCYRSRMSRTNCLSLKQMERTPTSVAEAQPPSYVHCKLHNKCYDPPRNLERARRNADYTIKDGRSRQSQKPPGRGEGCRWRTEPGQPSSLRRERLPAPVPPCVRVYHCHDMMAHHAHLHPAEPP